MKQLLPIVLIFFLSTIHPQNPGDNVFEGTKVHKINIIFSQPDYWDSLTYYYQQGDEQYISATVILNEDTMYNCGVRLKGNSSYSHPNNKKSIRIKFDQYIDQLWDGLKNIHLNNCYGDPTFLREKIHLDFCRDAGIPAPRANFANVFFNDTLFAFYSMVEHVDKKFLGSRYGDKDGDLFKAIDGFEGQQILSDFRWISSVPDSYYTRYELKTDGSLTAWGQLVTLLDSINNSPDVTTALPAAINLSSLYNGIASDILFANLDSYNNSGRNFYFYFLPTTGKMEWIKWDVGLSFGGYGGGVSNFENLNVAYIISTAQRPLMGKILSNTSLKNDYLITLCRLFKKSFSTSLLFPKIDAIANIIRPYVYADSRKQYTNTQFETNILSDLTSGGVGGSSRIPGLKSFLTTRQNSVQTQLTNLGIRCDILITPGEVVINEFMAKNTIIPDPSGEFDDWIELYNNTDQDINLGGLYLSDNFNNPTKWQFPDNTIISARGYLIVWADENPGQPGLHASFKLSQDGEEIRLSNIDASILDTVKFSYQVTNMTMARKPNGTGPFYQSSHTFNANNDSSLSVKSQNSSIPSKFKLEQNYPNPFNPSTMIDYQIPITCKVELKIFNVLGIEVATLVNEEKSPGYYSVEFNPGNLSSGVYFYKLISGHSVNTKRMLLIK